MFLAQLWETRQGSTQKEFLDFISVAALGGDVEAMFTLADAHDNGRYGAPPDFEMAATLYRQAADAAHPVAMYRLATMLETGRGVPRDPTEAEPLYRQAASLGFPPAMLQLAKLLDGNGSSEKRSREAAELAFGALSEGWAAPIEKLIEEQQNWTIRFRKSLQERLKREGLYGGPMDGQFGAGVASGVKRLAERTILHR